MNPREIRGTDYVKEMREFVLQFEEEMQDKCMRMFELFFNGKDTEEFEALCSELNLASAEARVDPWPIRVMDMMRREGSWPPVADKGRNTEIDPLGDPLREKLRPDFHLIRQFDGEVQKKWMRLYEIGQKRTVTRQEAEEMEILISQLKLADAERIGNPELKATVVAGEVAYEHALNKAREAIVTSCGTHSSRSRRVQGPRRDSF